MGARVSVTTSSHAASAAGRASDSAAASRDLPIGASPASGFSSALSAAARPAPREANGDAHGDPSPAAAAPSSTKSQAPATPAKVTAAAPNTVSSNQVQAAAATVVEAEASSIDADLTTPEDQAPEKGGGRSGAQKDDNSTIQADPTTLALLLAASGMQIDPRSGTGQQSGSGNTTPDGRAAAAPAGSAAASTVAAAALATPASSAQPPSSVASQLTGGTKTTAGSAASAPAVALTPTGQLDIDSPSAAVTSSVLSAPDASLNKSVAPDRTAPAPAPSAANTVSEMMRAQSTAPTQTTAVTRTISVPVSDRNWSGAVANQVQWMVSNNVQSATLQLSPEHLGPLEVHIDVQSSQVNVSFTASHPDTRSALEQGVPQLRAILANGGLTLGQASVQQEARSGSHYAASGSRSALSAAQTVDCVSVSSTHGVGLIDEYV
jgi:flagellar hook-length control protein FliK